MHVALSLGKCSSLKVLHLAKNKLGPRVVTILPHLSLCLNLEYLDLSSNGIEDQNGRFFVNLISHTRLRSLNLANNRVRNQTLEAIA
jgi:Ran GTPase-activating protein (RanGAP) involved in mRNA processing and transport